MDTDGNLIQAGVKIDKYADTQKDHYTEIDTDRNKNRQVYRQTAQWTVISDRLV